MKQIKIDFPHDIFDCGFDTNTFFKDMSCQISKQLYSLIEKEAHKKYIEKMLNS